MAKKVVVIRVGVKTIHIVHMENSATNPTIYGCVRIPTPEGAVKEGLIVDVGEIARRVRKACNEKGIRTKDAIFTVASSKIASRETTIPAVNKAKVSQLVMAKVPDLFPVDTEKYIFAYVLQGKEREDGDNGKVQDVMVFAAPSDLVDSYYTLATATGLNVVSIEADGNSIFQVMKRQVKEGVSMAVQINRDSTMINIISNEKLLLQRVVPYGFNVFTEVMLQEEVFQTDTEEKAYQVLSSQRVLLHSLNSDNPENDLSLEKRIEVTDNASFLIGNISRVIEYYNSKYKDQPITEIICTGQGASIAGIHELFGNELGIPSITPNIIAGVKFNRKIDIDAAILQYINCFGAVFNPVGFTPREVALRQAKKGSMTGPVLIFISCMLLSIVLAGFSIFRFMMTKDELDAIESRHTALAPVENEYNDLTAIVSNYELAQEVEDEVDTNNNDFHELIKRIEAFCPKSFTIQSIKADEESVVISAESTERLLSLSAVILQLEKIDTITNVDIREASKKTDPLSKKRIYSYSLTFNYTKAVVDAVADAVEEGGN